ncbi:hypothetical protein LXL04_017698 [Taraxacum kok-saghyz]
MMKGYPGFEALSRSKERVEIAQVRSKESSTRLSPKGNLSKLSMVSPKGNLDKDMIWVFMIGEYITLMMDQQDIPIMGSTLSISPLNLTSQWDRGSVEVKLIRNVENYVSQMCKGYPPNFRLIPA